MSKVNSTSLYITTNKIILNAIPDNPHTWQDLYRLVPYLRNSLCCVVCGNLLIEPLTPIEGKCQHHLCRKCKGGRKKIKPSCTFCKDSENYTENLQLRTLLQCYKRMCMFVINSDIYKKIEEKASTHNNSNVERGSVNLLSLIKEGATFKDDYRSNSGLSKSTYSILPCVYTNTIPPTVQVATTDNTNNIMFNTNLKNVSNRTSLYSVMYAGTGNKITIKRRPKEIENKGQKNNLLLNNKLKDSTDKGIFKKPPIKCVVKPRRGCRCGNATATPGKLTCCGQRCPCYVESKACIECKCRGCRNPHTPDGNKVINLPQLMHYQSTPQQSQNQFTVQQKQLEVPVLQAVKIELDANLTIEQLNEHLNLKVLEPYTKVPTTLPHTFLMSDIKKEDEDEITVDI